MEKKSKVMAALAAGAVALIVASGAVRCAMPATEGQGAPEAPAQEQQEQAPQTGGEGGGATATLASIEGTTWKSADGAATLDVLPGVLIESEGGTDSLSYFEASDVTESALGLTATLSVSKEKGGEARECALAVVKGQGSMRLTCDALSHDYVLETSGAQIAVEGAGEELEGLFGKGAADFAQALSSWAQARSPYATKATWSGEVWLDYSSGTKVTTFELDDAAGSVVSVTCDASGKLVAS